VETTYTPGEPGQGVENDEGNMNLGSQTTRELSREVAVYNHYRETGYP
jgi:hypothetical protein